MAIWQRTHTLLSGGLYRRGGRDLFAFYHHYIEISSMRHSSGATIDAESGL
jgi:hypothetical protein